MKKIILFTVSGMVFCYGYCHMKHLYYKTQKREKDKIANEYCELPDKKILIQIKLRSINKYTGFMYGSYGISFVNVN